MPLHLSEKQFNKLLNNKSLDENSKTNKFKNKKITVNGIHYDSTKEYERHCELLLQEKSNIISNLRYHKKEDKIVLIDDPLVSYIPDFCYDENNKHIVEDFKGMQTKEFILKKKMIISMIKKQQLDIVFRIVKYTQNGFEITEEYSFEKMKK